MSNNTEVEIKTETPSNETEEHPILKLTREYIENYEKLMQIQTQTETSCKSELITVPMQSLDMLSALITTIEKFVVACKHEDHKVAQNTLFPEGYKKLAGSIDTFTKDQLVWLLNQCQMESGMEIEPELKEDEMADEEKIAEWFRGFLKNKLICNYCDELGHQFSSCEKLFVMPCPLCGNEDHFGTECNSSKARLIKNKNRPLTVRGRGNGRPRRGVSRGNESQKDD